MRVRAFHPKKGVIIVSMLHKLIRRLGLVIFGLIFFSAGAAEFPKSSLPRATARDITRLDYYPHPRTLYLAGGLAYAPTLLSTSQKGPSPENSSRAHYLQADFSAILGLPLDGLRLEVSESWQIHRWNNTTTAKTAAVNQTDASGLSDPTIALHYRVLRSYSRGLFGDVSLGASPSVTPRNAATPTAEGNDGKGYSTADVSGALYWITGPNDLSLAATLTRDFAGDSNNPTNATASFHREATWTSSFTTVDRLHVSEDLYLQGSLTFNLPYSYDQTNSATPPVTTANQYPFHVSPGAGVGYRIFTQGVIDAVYSYQNYTTTNVPATPPNVDAHQIQNVVQIRFRLAL